MSRLAAAVEHGALVALMGICLGLLDGTLAQPWPEEPLLLRISGAVGLDLLLLLPLMGLGALLGLLRPRAPSRRSAAAASLLLLITATGLIRAAQLDGDLAERLEVWRLAQPLPRLALPQGDEGPPPVVLISVDTLRYDALAHMPRLRARAQDALRFTQARSHAPWTLPAMASILTGLPPQQHGAGWPVDVDRPHRRSALAAEVRTLPEQLREWGYVTAAVLSNPFLSPRFGLTRGLDRAWDLSRDASTRRALRRSSLLRPWVSSASDGAEAVTDRALRALSRLSGGRYFLWVHYLEPHAPYALSPDPEGGCVWPECFGAWGAVRSGARTLSEAELAQLRTLYAADLARLDEALARLLEEVLGRGALVVLVADHGEAFGEHGGFEHGSSFYDEQVRVPLMLWAPGVEGQEVTRSVGTSLVTPAALAWAAEEGLGPLGVDGAASEVQMGSILFGEAGSACVSGGRKLIAHGGREVYDVIADPVELVGISENGAPTCGAEEAAVVGADPGGWGRLRGLGYVE